MSPASPRIALYIDGANLHATARTLGFDLDYKRLLAEFCTRGTVLRAFYYAATVEDQEYSSLRPLLDWLDYNGYTVVARPAKEFVDAGGRRKIKGNMEVTLAVDAMEFAAEVDEMDIVFGRRRFPSPHRSGAAPWCPRYRRLHNFVQTADRRGRAAPPGGRFHRSGEITHEDRP